MGLVSAIGWSDRNMEGGSWTSPSWMRGGVEEVEQQWVDKMVSPNLEEKRRLPRCWLTVVAKKQWLPGGDYYVVLLVSSTVPISDQFDPIGLWLILFDPRRGGVLCC